MIPKILSCLLILHTIFFSLSAQQPKLVVGLVVDQMRADYLYRFKDHFGEGGFKRLMKDGSLFTEAHYGYALTETGPGHATIYTGVQPAIHGIVSNAWLEKGANRLTYCVSDTQVTTIGAESGGQRSPHFMSMPTLGDQMKLAFGEKCKVVSVAIKDRSAILPAGHAADLAVWWDDDSGNWISSSKYTNKLPKWLEDFNRNNPVSLYLRTWNTSLDSEKYNAHNQFEEPFNEAGSTSFPYDYKSLSNDLGIKVIKTSPYGNSYTFDLALTALKEEKLGQDDVPDLLAVSFSSTDYIGHQFGPDSEEIVAAYQLFDKELTTFLKNLDEVVGPGNYILFLTSDHGVMPNIGHAKATGQLVNLMDREAFETRVNQLLKEKTGGELIRGMFGSQVYLNYDKMTELKLKPDAVQRQLVQLLNEQPEILSAISAHDLQFKEQSEFPAAHMKNSYFPGRSGDVFYITRPYSGDNKHLLGAGHGSPYRYDTHVPLIFFGANVKKGGLYEEAVDVTSIVPTICHLLGIESPPACSAGRLMRGN